MTNLNKDMINRLLDIIDVGLCSGKGEPVPGGMCVEAAVTTILGEEFSDQPSCVHPILRSFGITLNDALWSSNTARAAGMRDFAVAQLGTVDNFDFQYFINKMAIYAIKTIVPQALRAAAELQQEPHKSNLLAAADRCETEGSIDACSAASNAASNAAWAASYAASNAARAASYAARAASYAASAASDAASNAAWAASNAARAASNAAWAASNASSDEILINTMKYAVSILVEMETAGSKFLNINNIESKRCEMVNV